MFRSQSFFLRQTTASAFRYYYISFSISSRDYAQPESILGGYHTAHSSLLANSRVKKTTAKTKSSETGNNEHFSRLHPTPALTHKIWTNRTSCVWVEREEKKTISSWNLNAASSTIETMYEMCATNVFNSVLQFSATQIFRFCFFEIYLLFYSVGSVWIGWCECILYLKSCVCVVCTILSACFSSPLIISQPHIKASDTVSVVCTFTNCSVRHQQQPTATNRLTVLLLKFVFRFYFYFPRFFILCDLNFKCFSLSLLTFQL